MTPLKSLADKLAAAEGARPMRYAEMDGPQLLEACGNSAMNWATAFQEIVIEGNVPIDVDLMIGWFANAIERSNDKRRWEREANAVIWRDEINSAVYQALGQASMCWHPRPSGEFDSSAASEVGRLLCLKIGAEPFLQGLHARLVSDVSEPVKEGDDK